MYTQYIWIRHSAYSLLLNKVGITRNFWFFFLTFSLHFQLFIKISRRKTSRTTKYLFVPLNIFILLPFAVWMTKSDSICVFSLLPCSSLFARFYIYFNFGVSSGFGFGFYFIIYVYIKESKLIWQRLHTEGVLITSSIIFVNTTTKSLVLDLRVIWSIIPSISKFQLREFDKTILGKKIKWMKYEFIGFPPWNEVTAYCLLNTEHGNKPINK